MKRSSKALRMAQPLAVVAVWAGLLGYVIPAAFSTAPTVSATAASAASAASRGAAGTLEKGSRSPDRRSLSPAEAQNRHPGPAMVRVMQAALRPHRVSVTLGHQPLSHDQAFASITPYRSVHPGTWIVRAVGAGRRATIRVTLAAGSRTTLVVLADRSHLVISAPEVPPGATPVAAAGASRPVAAAGASRPVAAAGALRPVAATGALRPVAATPKPGGSPVPWLVLGGTGLLLALAGVARLRQLRWARRVAAHIR
jgi:hypothetical protein